MDILKYLITACVGALLAAGHTTASAAPKLPLALTGTGTVCAFSTSPAGGDHTHGLDNWKLKARTTQMAIHERLSGAKYIDVLWSWPNELQDPDLLIVNQGSNPVLGRGKYQDGCAPAANTADLNSGTNIPDFVFAFAIHQVENAPDADERISPHAIVFLPINTGHEPANSAQEFQVLLFHMGSSGDDCPAPAGEDRDQCIALWELRSKWESGGHSTAELEKDVAERIRKILKVGISVPGLLPLQLRNSFSASFLRIVVYHNGVIHGMLR